MNINDLRKALQNKNVYNLYLISGNEKYLIDLAIGEFVNNGDLISVPELNYSRIKDPIIFSDFKRICCSFPFMSERRLVIVNINCFAQQDIEKVISFINDLPEYLVLVIVIYTDDGIGFTSNKNNNKKNIKNNVVTAFSNWYRKNVKSDQIINCTSVVKNNTAIIDYLCCLAAKNNKVFSRSDAEFLYDYCATDYNTLINELGKLLSVCEKTITRKEIMEYCIKSDEYKAYMLHEYLVWHEYEKSLELFMSILLENEKPIWIVAMLSKYVDLLIQVKLCTDAGYEQIDIIRIIESNTSSKSWQIKKAIHEAERYNLQNLLDMIHCLCRIDLYVKHGELYGNWDLYGLLINIYR